MKKFSPVAVAFVSSCLVFFHSNPAFAAVIDAAGAIQEDAALAPLDEPDDGTGEWNNNTGLANKAQQQREKSKSIVPYYISVPFCFVLFLPF